ncbi:2-oxoisovalerate dehydrogenase, partial [Paenibacillus riograndensis]
MESQGTVETINRHKPLGLSDGQVIDMYRTMQLGRKYDERSLLLQRAVQIHFHFSGIGQEAAQVAAAFALDRENDYFLPYYRDYAFVLSVGMTTRELMLSVFAKAEDPNNEGRQMPGRVGRQRLRIGPGSIPLRRRVPTVVGCGVAAKLESRKV